MDDPREEIRRVIEQRLAAIRNKDAKAALSSLASDVVAFEMVPPLALPPGAARDLDAFAAWLEGLEEIDLELRDLIVEAGGDLGFARSLNHLQAIGKAGRRVDLWMRSTLCFRREAGEWKIVHAHTSVPFYPGGEAKAAIDLQP
ncbi:MAG TPA: nuclear transport factor 2 family protein [Sphingomicrobium sp.]|jgi:ketosteroid isomerase-like protein|nr:nuclear transport factor 2 family protein [Sphingomicrobium sp.]